MTLSRPHKYTSTNNEVFAKHGIVASRINFIS